MIITKKFSTSMACIAHALAAIAIAGLIAGPAPVAAQQFAPISKAILTVSTSAIGIPAATLLPSGASGYATRCEFTVETSDVRYYYTGDTPTGSAGHIWYAGATYSLTGTQALRNFRTIRISTASSDATVTISCWK
jgi:hypothetical protein